MNHSYKNHEIEVTAEDNDTFIQANAKFKPVTGYVELLAFGVVSRALKQGSRRFCNKLRRSLIIASNNNRTADRFTDNNSHHNLP